jgi:hypothetical protein
MLKMLMSRSKQFMIPVYPILWAGTHLEKRDLRLSRCYKTRIRVRSVYVSTLKTPNNLF